MNGRLMVIDFRGSSILDFDAEPEKRLVTYEIDFEEPERASPRRDNLMAIAKLIMADALELMNQAEQINDLRP